MMDERELLRESFRRIVERDKNLAGQLDKLRAMSGHPELTPTLRGVKERIGGLEAVGSDSQLSLETIVNRVGRPVLEVANDDYVVEGPEAAIWEARLGNATVRAALRRVIPSVGRIEIDGHPDFTWVGTGWLIADDIVVTNRHVASEFAALSLTAGGRSFVFKRAWPDREARMAARIDFRRELRNNTPRAFVVKDVLHIEDDDGPDFAFLRVEQTGASGTLSPSLRPAGKAATASQYIAAVGYPAADSRIPEQQLMSQLFGDKYNVKRLAPGQVQRIGDDLVYHDCTTLGGNSGSPIIDLETGEILGLHFSGVFLRENRSVPIGYVLSRLQKLNNLPRPRPEGESKPASSIGSAPQGAAHAPASLPTASWTIPLQVTIAMGVPTVSVSSETGPLAPVTVTPSPAPMSAPSPAPENAEGAVAEIRGRLANRPDVLTVRSGYQFRNGWITPDPAVVVIMRDRLPATLQELGLPSQSMGFPIAVRVAGPWDVAQAQAKLESLEGLPKTTYTPPTEFALEEIEETMKVTCHVSPDAGWPTLREFLAGTRKGLTIGMYDFTAPHVIEEVLNAVRDGNRQLTLVMQEGESMTGKPNDIKEEITIARYRAALNGRFIYAPASVGKDRQFASAYHIKVAVRDGKALWLSSGNWQSSNQPNHGVAFGETSWDLLMGHNREWHVVIENPALAKQFEKYLMFDLRNAKADAGLEAVAPPDAFFLVDEAVEERVPTGAPTYFKPLEISNRPVKVRPLLTPDNYEEYVLALIKTAERRILFQNQSLSLLGVDANGDPKDDQRFGALVDALLEKQQQGIDLRIIIRGEFAPVKPLEELQRRGFDMSKVRLQNRCHTKGIIVDGARMVLGSHNWTNQGTLVNRDASLIFEDEEIAAYFEEIFWFDWKHLTRQSVGGRRVVPARGDDNEAVPRGMRRVSWQEIVNGD